METVTRITIIFLFLMLALRVIGKRELGELSPFDLLMIMLIPEIVSHGMIQDDFSITNALVGVATLLSLVMLNSFLSYRFKFFRKLIEGSPVILYRDGKIMNSTLHKERVSLDEILSEIRTQGYERFDQMRWVVLEPDGKISCIPKENT